LDRFGLPDLQVEAKGRLCRAVVRQYDDFMQLLLVRATAVRFVISQPSTSALLLVLTVVNAWLG
jgi:hypothetical protein